MGASTYPARRWLLFNGVGILGFVVQLGVLTGLIRLLDVHYLVATVVAVEAAILHNFFWHQRHTWRDRPSAGASTRRRLARFHLLNGTVSLAGNALVMLLLTGSLGVDPVRANVVAVLACSIVNFFGSEMLVFRTAAVVLALVLTPAAVSRPHASDTYVAAELQAKTLAAWEAYQRQVDDRYRKDGTFAHDAFGRDKNWREVARGGAIAMFETDRPLPGGQTVEVPDGTINHWVGAVFIPGATLAGRTAGPQAECGQGITVVRGCDCLKADRAERRPGADLPEAAPRKRLRYRPLQHRARRRLCDRSTRPTHRAAARPPG